MQGQCPPPGIVYQITFTGNVSRIGSHLGGGVDTAFPIAVAFVLAVLNEQPESKRASRISFFISLHSTQIQKAYQADLDKAQAMP